MFKSKNMRYHHIIIALVFSLGFNSHSIGQTTIVTSDFELWSGLGVEKSLGDHFKIGIDQDFRFWQNASSLDKQITELSLGYSFWDDRLTLGSKFRYTKDMDVDLDFDHERRYSAFVKFEHKPIKRLELNYRLMYQNENDFGSSLGANDTPTHDWRFKATADYNIKGWKLDPAMSFELFRSSDSNSELAGSTLAGFSKARLTLGTSYKIKNVGSVKAFYRVERELTDYYPATIGIAGVGFTYDLDNLFKKKSEE